MLRRQALLIATDPQLVSSGLQPDKHPAMQLLWEAAANVLFFAGKVRRRKADSLTFNTGFAGPIRGLLQQRLANGTRRIVMAVRDSALTNQFRTYYWDGGSSTFIQLMTGYLDETTLRGATFIDMVALGDWVVLNNGEEKARLLKPGVSTTQPTQWPALAVQYMKKGPFLLALGTGPRKTGVNWSDGDNWETFTPSASNLAGGLFIDDFDTPLVAASRIGNAIAAYSEDQMALVSYIGEPYYFGQKVALDGIGAVGKFSVCSDGRNNFGVGRGGVWWTDGISFRYIDEGFLHDYLQENVNWGQKSKITASRNDFRGTIEFFFPMGVNTEPSEGWSFDPRTGGWGPIPAAPIKDERKLLTKPLVGTADGKVMLDDDDPAVAAPLTLRTRPLLLQVQDQSGLRDIHTDTRVDEIELFAKKATAVQFRYGTTGEVGGIYSWSVWRNVDPTVTTYKLESLPTGVFHKLEFQSTATNWDLDLQGFMFFGQVEGSKRGTQ